ncbi:MAG TPA: ATP-binding protein [Vicinamibacteria bacterium]|nr:ATP-binding protein [Vicinamibacteria bacterium]
MPRKASRRGGKDDGPKRRAAMELRFPSESRYLHMVHELTRRLAESTGFDASEAEKIALAVDEAATNVIQHAYHGEPGHSIEVHFDPEGESLDIVIFHDGEALESLPVPDFDLEDLVAKRRKGGLGLTIMREMMDKVEHAKAGAGRNMCVMVRYKQKGR